MYRLFDFFFCEQPAKQFVLDLFYHSDFFLFSGGSRWFYIESSEKRGHETPINNNEMSIKIQIIY